MLDVWEPEMVAVMKSMGNVKSNEIFEKVIFFSFLSIYIYICICLFLSEYKRKILTL